MRQAKIAWGKGDSGGLHGKTSAKRKHLPVFLSVYGERNALPVRIAREEKLWALGDCLGRGLGGLSFQEGKCVESVSVHSGFRVSDGGMVGDVGQGQPNQSVVGVSARVVEIVGVDHGIDSFRGASLLVDFLEQPACPGHRRKKPGVVFGLDVDEGSRGAFRLAIPSGRAEVFAKDVGLVLNSATWIPGLRYMLQSGNSRKRRNPAVLSTPGIQPLRPE